MKPIAQILSILAAVLTLAVLFASLALALGKLVLGWMLFILVAAIVGGKNGQSIQKNS